MRREGPASLVPHASRLTPRAFVIGHPIGHSLSPAIHNAAFAALGIDARYEAVDVSPEDLEPWVSRARQSGVLGFSVTVPHKERIMSCLDRVDGDAVLAGAVNTVTASADGSLVGTNTDTEGFRRSLAEEAGTRLAGQDVVLLGAGGAARAIALVAHRDGVSTLSVVNRHRERAERLLAHLAPIRGTIRVRALASADPSVRDALRGASIVVNATSVGMGSAEVPVDPATLPPSGLVVDIVYNPRETALLRAARSRGAHVLGGLGMLVYQAAAAFEAWTGVAAPTQVMWEAAETALSERRAVSHQPSAGGSTLMADA